MANPLIDQGSLNRLLGSVMLPDLPSLNVTPSFLGPEAISMTLEGEATANIPGLTGTVTSPEPYQMATIVIHLQKSQGLAELWKQRHLTNTRLGQITVRLDSMKLSPYIFTNCSIKGVEPLSSSGKDAGYVLRLSGSYPINDNLWDGI